MNAFCMWDKHKLLEAKRQTQADTSPTYEQVLFWEHIRQSGLFVDPAELAVGTPLMQSAP